MFFHKNEEVIESADPAINPAEEVDVDRSTYYDQTQSDRSTSFFPDGQRKQLHLDARALFMQDLQQVDLNNLSQKQIDLWYQEATRKIEKSETGPDSYKAGKVNQEMHRRWREHRRAEAESA